MELDRISISYGRKINLGNYESADTHVSYSSDLREDESFTQAYQRVVSICRAELAAQEEYIRSMGVAVTPPKPRQDLRLP